MQNYRRAYDRQQFSATQTKNFLSSFSPFGGGVGGGAEQRNARKFLVLPARVRERGWGAFQREWSVRKNLKPPRTWRVRISRSATGNGFNLYCGDSILPSSNLFRPTSLTPPPARRPAGSPPRTAPPSPVRALLFCLPADSRGG